MTKFGNRCWMSVKKSFLFPLLFFSLTAFAGDIMKNGKFEPDPVSGKMTGWTTLSARLKDGRTACIFQEGTAVLTLEPGEEMIALIQRDLPLESGKQYRLAFEARGSEGAVLSDYLEWVFASGKYGNSGTFKRELTQEWKACSTILKVPDLKSEFKSTPYLAFTLKTPGKAEIRHVSLEEVTPKSADHRADGIADPGFDDPENGAWKLKKNSRILASGGRTSPGVLALSGKNASASLDLDLAPGKMYRLSYFVKGRNETESSSGFSDYLCILKLNGKTIWGTDRKQDCIQRLWQERSQIVRVPKGEASARLTITVRSLSAGDILLDDFMIREIRLVEEKPLKIRLSLPAYRNMIFSSDPIDHVKGTIRTKSEVRSIAVTFNGKTVFVKPGEEFSFPARDLKIGTYDLAAEALTVDGKKVRDTLTVRKLAPAENEVVFNHEKQLLVNGKPFFFCGVNNLLSQSFGSPLVRYYARRTGLCMMRWAGSDDLKEMLDLCHQAGIKVSLNLGVVTRYSKARDAARFKADWEKLLAGLEAVKQHPALIEYYAFDEPLWNGTPPEIMKYVYESLKEMDPYHPVAYVEAPRGTPDEWRPYAQYCDVFGIDIYPVPEESGHSELTEKGLRSVGLYTRLSSEAVNGEKPVRMWLQAFDWGCLAARRKSFHRSPTQEEFRFMNFDALLNGSSSVEFYRDRNIDEAAEKYMYEEINLFSRFAPALLFGKEIPNTAESSGNVLIRITEYKGARYMAVLNRDNEAGVVMLPDGTVWYRMEPGKAAPVKERKIKLPKLSCRLFSSAVELPLENTIPAIPEMEEKIPGLFHHICLRPRLLDPAAKWIWSADDREKQFCFAIRKITISKPVKKAVLRMTADDEFTCYLDGEKIFAGSDWKHLSDCDLAEKLKAGSHILTVRAVNRGGPGAFIGDLVIEYEDGTKEVIVTDSSWMAASKDISDGKNDSGKPAKEIAPLGKGPWRM